MRVIWVSLDSVFKRDMEILKNLPNIGRLIQCGLSTDTLKTVFPAMTYPAHVTMMTGTHPIDHGIGHNQPFPLAFEDSDNMRPWHWDAREIAGETIFEKLKKANKTSAAILWPVTGKHRVIKYLFPEVLALPGENQLLKMLAYGNPFYILGTEIRYGRQRKSAREPDLSDYATLLIQKLLLKKQPPDFLALHLVDVDTMRHHHGTDSPEAHQALLRNDRRVGSILKVMDDKDMWRDTVICLISDHGQADITRFVCLYDALCQNGIHAYPQSFGMGAAIYAPRQEQLEAAEVFLNANKEALGIKHVFNRAALDTLKASREYSLCVEAQSGTVFTDCLSGAKKEKATHGFSNAHEGGDCVMVLAGAGIKKGGHLPIFDMAQVAPVLYDIATNGGKYASKLSDI